MHYEHTLKTHMPYVYRYRVYNLKVCFGFFSVSVGYLVIQMTLTYICTWHHITLDTAFAHALETHMGYISYNSYNTFTLHTYCIHISFSILCTLSLFIVICVSVLFISRHGARNAIIPYSWYPSFIRYISSGIFHFNIHKYIMSVCSLVCFMFFCL